MKCRFDVSTHRYYIDEQRVPGVTGVLNYFFPFPPTISPDVLEAARVFGNNVHATVDLFNRGILNEAKLSPGLRQPLVQWKQFLFDHKIAIVETEKRVFSARGYGGTLDSIGQRGGALKGKMILLDLKTGMYRHTFELQTDAYLNAYYTRPIDVMRTDRMCITLDGKNRYSIRLHKDKSDFNNFLGLLGNYKRLISKREIPWEN